MQQPRMVLLGSGDGGYKLRAQRGMPVDGGGSHLGYDGVKIGG